MHSCRRYLVAAAAIAAALIPASSLVAAAGGSPASGDDPVARGRYLVQIGGCNDCHTPGYARSGGKVPESRWLTGSSVGFRGPWGTSYPANLRLYMAGMSEDDWVKAARTMETRPPMPWYDVRKMSEEDLRAIHRYIVSLGKAGETVPESLAPGVAPKTAYIDFTPKPPRHGGASSH